MKPRHLSLAALAIALAATAQDAWTSGPGAAPVSLENPSTGAPRGRFKHAVRFHSSGRITYATGTKERDRTITIAPVEQDGVVQMLEARIVDHVDDDFEYQGQLMVDASGKVWSRQKEMVNAANILAVTPAVIDRLRSGAGQVQTSGSAEVSGDVYDVACTHQLIGKPEDRPLRVRTVTTTRDGKIALETVAAFDGDGLPISAETTGLIKHMITLHVELRLTRLAPARTGGVR